MTLRDEIEKFVAVGEEFDIPSLTSRMYPSLRPQSAEWCAKRSKLAMVVKKDSKDFGTYKIVGMIDNSGRANIWRRLE